MLYQRRVQDPPDLKRLCTPPRAGLNRSLVAVAALLLLMQHTPEDRWHRDPTRAALVLSRCCMIAKAMQMGQPRSLRLGYSCSAAGVLGTLTDQSRRNFSLRGQRRPGCNTVSYLFESSVVFAL